MEKTADTGNEPHMPNPPTATAKRTYVAPKLTHYGTLARLTRHGQGSGTDGGAVMSMMCL